MKNYRQLKSPSLEKQMEVMEWMYVTKSWTQLKQLSMHAHIQLEDELVWVCREVHVHFFCQSCHRSEELEG